MGLNFVVTVVESAGLIAVPDHIHIGAVSLVVSVLVFIVVSALSRKPRNELLFEEFYGLPPRVQVQPGNTVASATDK